MTRFDLEINRILKEVKSLAIEQGKLTGFCIGNTRKVNSTGLYFSPIRNATKLVAGSAIVYSVDQAVAVARQVDGKVDYVLVDTEKKVSPELYGKQNIGNVERAVRETVHSSKILTYKGNDLTVDSIESFIVQVLSSYPRGLSGKKAVIIGAGNIGSKLALKLVERGMDVVITRRDREKLDTIVSALNFIKPKETVATVSGTLDNMVAVNGAHLLIGLTDGSSVITAAMIEALITPGVILLDGGKGCFLPEAISLAEREGIPIYRADVRPGFEGHIGMALETERMVLGSLGRKEINGIPIVSGGLLARKNEVVVDNVNDPRVVFGLAGGMGDFIRNLDTDQEGRVQEIQNYIDDRRTK